MSEEPEKNIDGLEQGGADAPSFLPATKMYETAGEEKEVEPSESTETVEEVEETQVEPTEEITVETTETESEADTIASFQELVESNSWDWDWFKTLKANVGSQEVPFSDLVREFKDRGVADGQIKEAKAQKQALEQELVERRQELDSQFVIAAKLIENAENFFKPQAESVDWTKLRDEDPAEYAAKKAEFAEYNKSLDSAKSEIKEEYEKAVAEQQKQLLEQRDQQIELQRAKLLENFPELSDEAELEKRGAILQNHLRTQGFSSEEIGNFFDARLVTMAEYSRLWLESQSKTNVAKKKVAKIPKVMKSGAKVENKKPRPKDAASILYGT